MQPETITTLITYSSLDKYKKSLIKWQTYVGQLHIEAESDDAGFSHNVLEHAEKVLLTLCEYFRQDNRFLVFPIACPGDSDNFMFVWDRDEHHLECELFSNGNVEFFYRNRTTKKLWEENTTLVRFLQERLSSGLLEKLEFFVTSEM